MTNSKKWAISILKCFEGLTKQIAKVEPFSSLS